MKSDLHVHSSYSDGEYSVEELVLAAKEKGLYAMALTDHDTVKGVNEAVELGKKHKINIVKGIELSSIKVGDVHIIGLGIDADNRNLLSVLDEVVKKRELRNRAILQKLEELKIYVSEAELKEIGEGKIIGRKLIADIMIRKGYVKSVAEAFDEYLASGRAAYVPIVRLTPKDAIDVIHSAGGYAVLAHPTKLPFKGAELESFIKELKAVGLDGIEGYYYSHTEEEVRYFVSLAKSLSLFVTGGSDFHGEYRSSRLGDTSGETDKETIDKLLKK